MQTLGIYLNERASGGNGRDWTSEIQRSFFRSSLRFHAPRSLEELSDALGKDIEDKVHSVICVGGDGTLNRMVQTLAYSNVGVLVVPAGTANDLATELGNSSNMRKLAQTISNEESKHIDLIRINNQYMATNGGFGIGSDVAEKINYWRSKIPFFKELMKLTGKKIYSLMLPSEFLNLKYERYPIRVESEEFTGEVACAAVLINNQPTLAGTFCVAPQTRHDDGTFNVTLVASKNRVHFAQTILALAAGYYPANDSQFMSFETKKVSLTLLNSCKKLKFFGDGEILSENGDRWDVEIAPRALKVYSPHTNKKNLLELTNEVSLT